MALWQIIMGPATGGHDVAVTQAHSRTFNFRLTDPHEASFTMDANTPAGKYIQELATDVHAIRNNRYLYRGRVGPTADDGDDKSNDLLDIRTFDYRELLKRRRLYTGNTLTFSSVDQGEIGWRLINTIQGNSGGNLGISPGTGWPTGVLRDRTYVLGDSVGERVQELSEVDSGFEWDIVPLNASALAYNVYYPSRGSNKGVVLEHGGLVSKYRRETDPGSYANAIRETGDSSAASPPTDVTGAVSDIATRPEGRWDAVYGTDIQTQAALQDRFNWQLAQAQVIPVSYSLTLKRNAWNGPDHIWLGDTVEVVINSGRLSVDSLNRVFEIAVTVDDDGNEDVTIQAGTPSPDIRYLPANILRRISELERR